MPSAPRRHRDGAPTGPVLDSATHTARQTELAWLFPHGPGGEQGPLGREAVWEALAAAAALRDLTPLSADRSVGLLLARPPFSLANMGRRVALSVSRRPGGTLVRATLLHGLLCLQGRAARVAQLEDVLQAAWLLLERADRERGEERAARERPGAAPDAPPPAGEPAPPHPPAAPLAAQGPQAPRPPQAVPEPPAEPGPLRAAPGPAPDYRHTPWEELPLEAPPARTGRLPAPRPARAGLGVRRSLLWFLVGTVLAVGAVFLLGILDP